MGDQWQTKRAPVARASERRAWRLAVVVAVLIAVVGISASVQAGTAAGPGAGVTGTDSRQQLTGLAASVLTRPSAVRGTDGRLHIAYELVLTGATGFGVDVEQVAVRDAKTHRVLHSLGGDALSSRMNPAGGAPVGVAPPPTTLIGPSGSAVIWLDVLVRRKAGLPGGLEHRIVSSTRPPPGEQSTQVRAARQPRRPQWDTHQPIFSASSTMIPAGPRT